jgi:muramoyltetrapeptide carboxypeptidase
MPRPFVPLAPGEPIGVVALSGPVESPDALAEGLRTLEGWGHRLVLAPNIRSRDHYLAGDDDARLEGLEWVLGQGARVVMAVRGGYGVTRILPALPLHRLAARGTCFVGFSDATALLNAMVAAGAAPQVHGPMVAAGLSRRPNGERLRSILEGQLTGAVLFRFTQRRVIRGGSCEGRAVGGNLSLLESLIGTPFEPDLEGAVLFLEDVGEPLYRLDRMLTHLRSSARLRDVKALICGSLRGCGPVRERTETWRRLVAEAAPADAAVVVDLPFGHSARNLAFPVGATVEVNTDAGLVSWSH